MVTHQQIALSHTRSPLPPLPRMHLCCMLYEYAPYTLTHAMCTLICSFLLPSHPLHHTHTHKHHHHTGCGCGSCRTGGRGTIILVLHGSGDPYRDSPVWYGPRAGGCPRACCHSKAPPSDDVLCILLPSPSSFPSPSSICSSPPSTSLFPPPSPYCPSPPPLPILIPPLSLLFPFTQPFNYLHVPVTLCCVQGISVNQVLKLVGTR